MFNERPVSFVARAATYSNYKKHNTVKAFIAIAPEGSIAFISKAWGGRVSNKALTQKCGFLNLIQNGDVILAIVDSILLMSLLSEELGLKCQHLPKVKNSYQLVKLNTHVN